MVNGPSVLPQVLAVVGVSQPGFAVGLLGHFVEVAEACRVKATSPRDDALCLRPVGTATAANKLNRISIARVVVRHATHSGLKLFAEVPGALSRRPSQSDLGLEHSTAPEDVFDPWARAAADKDLVATLRTVEPHAPSRARCGRAVQLFERRPVA